MNVTLFINGMLFASAVLVFFLSIQINKIIKKRIDLINEYKKDLYRYRDLLTEYLNFINSVETDIRKYICSKFLSWINDIRIGHRVFMFYISFFYELH